MIGTYANGYHFSVYDYHGDGQFTLFKWDAESHLVYLVSALVNFPAKELTYMAYVVRHKMLRDKETQLTDAFIGVGVDLVELSVGVVYSSIGVVIGTFAHPLNTIRDAIPAVPLLGSTMVEAVTRSIFQPFKILLQD